MAYEISEPRNGSTNFTYDENDLGLLLGQDHLEKQLLTYYMMGIAGITLCCLGIIGNILSAIVLTRRTMRSSTYSYLCALSACDTLVLFCTMLLLTKDTHTPTLEEISPPGTRWYSYMFPIVHPTTVSFQVTSIWLTLAFTVDRYIMICHPFQAERMCNVKRARKVIVGLGIAGIIFNIPRFFEYRTGVDEWQMQNQTQVFYSIDFTEIGTERLYKEIVHSWMYLTCVCGIPFLALAVLNAFLIKAVHLSRKKGKEINVVERRRNDTTVMLIGVILVFFVCQVPALIGRMIWAFDVEAYKSKEYYILNEVGNLLVVLNSAINIVPYYFFGNKFRKEFGHLICWCFMGKDFNMTKRLSLSFDNPKDPAVSMNGQNRRVVLRHMSNVSADFPPRQRNSVDAPLIMRHNNGCKPVSEGIPMTIMECNGNCKWSDNGATPEKVDGCHGNCGCHSDNSSTDLQKGKYYSLLCFKIHKKATPL